jgi:hypothetical protein
MMKVTLGMTAVAIAISGSVLAQERAAGQANDAQVNWAALSTKLNALDTQNKSLAASMVTLQASVTALTTTVNALSSKILVMDGKLTAIAACGAQQKIWNGSSCVTSGSSDLRWQFAGDVPYTHSSNVYTDAQNRAAATPTCTGMIGAKCTTKGQMCLSGVVIDVGITSSYSSGGHNGSPSTSYGASTTQGVVVCGE